MKLLHGMLSLTMAYAPLVFAVGEDDFNTFEQSLGNPGDIPLEEMVSTNADKNLKGVILRVPEDQKETYAFGELRFTDAKIADAQSLEQAFLDADEGLKGASQENFGDSTYCYCGSVFRIYWGPSVYYFSPRYWSSVYYRPGYYVNSWYDSWGSYHHGYYVPGFRYYYYYW